MTSITVYDGHATVGGNKIYVEEGGSGVLLDFGMNFARYGMYFDGFLSERPTRGIHDLLMLGLIPKLNIYRKDLLTPDVDVSHLPKPDIRAVVLSHPHMDHFGNIGLLDERIPLVASPIAAAVIKAMRDCSGAKFNTEATYFSPREREEEPRVLKIPRNSQLLAREYLCSERPSEGLVDFLCSVPGGKEVHTQGIRHHEEENLPFDLKHHPVDHSIYGSNAYVLSAEVDIAYTGDFRLHGMHANASRAFVRSASGASVLIIEGTRVSREHDFPESEAIVEDNCLKAIEECDGLVVANFSPRNFERLETFRSIAKRTGRMLVILPKEAYMLHALECCDGVCRMDGLGIYSELKGTRRKWETEVVYEMWEENYVDPMEISRNPGGYILCLSFFDIKHLLDIRPDGGLYVHSSSEAFTEEMKFDFVRLYNWLKLFGFDTCGFVMEKYHGVLRPVFIRGYHASGHASKEDIEWVIDRIDPDLIIPVHTESPQWFSENFENVVVPEAAEPISV